MRNLLKLEENKNTSLFTFNILRYQSHVKTNFSLMASYTLYQTHLLKLYFLRAHMYIHTMIYSGAFLFSVIIVIIHLFIDVSWGTLRKDSLG